MNEPTLLAVIAAATFVFMAVCIVGFVLFSRFLNREKDAAERFRAMHLNKTDDTE